MERTLIPSGVLTSTVFPEQWLRCCLAVQTDSGLLQWVVDGHVIEDGIFEGIKDSAGKETNLTGRILLGRTKWPSSGWAEFSNKVAALNIFSSAFSVKEMLEMTMGECGKDGDYFAWGNMTWTLTGSAELEVWQKEDICSEPAIHIFNTKFPSWDSCVQHCQKINSRIPSVVTSYEWKILERFFEDNVYNKGLDIEELWLSVSDEENEGEWADYSTHKRMVHPGNFEVGQPNGGEVQNHVLLLPSGEWSDKEKEFSGGGCICDRNSSSVLQLRGLDCKTIDSIYKPVSTKADVTDFIYRGDRGTEIRFADGSWRFTVFGSNIAAVAKASQASYVLGKFNWTIEGDNPCSSSSSMELKLTGCESGSFTCDNGQLALFDISISDIDCRYIDTFKKYRYRYRHRQGDFGKYRYRYRQGHFGKYRYRYRQGDFGKYRYRYRYRYRKGHFGKYRYRYRQGHFRKYRY